MRQPTDSANPTHLEILNLHQCFGGVMGFYRHDSAETRCSMRFSVFVPPLALKQQVPVLYYLAGLTCNEETFMIKAGAQRIAAELGIMLVAPDTSPRGVPLPGDSDSWDFGVGAGFYLDATAEPWAQHYRMYSYVTRELPALIEANFPVDMARMGIFGHSMGGHGALTIALKNPDLYHSVSAFAPISAPMRAPWGEKAFSNYLGPDRQRWKDHDATELVLGLGGCAEPASDPDRSGPLGSVPGAAAAPALFRRSLPQGPLSSDLAPPYGVRSRVLLRVDLHGRSSAASCPGVASADLIALDERMAITVEEEAQSLSRRTPGFLDRERIVAGPGFNRWLVPPAALCIHLCIGMAYGFSVFWLPLSRALGVDHSVECANATLLRELFSTTCDWRVSSLGWMYTLFFVFLGVSAAVWGGWLERSGPRKAGVIAALCWTGGLVLGAVGVFTHQLWLLWLGSGVIGGIGLGLGYISPVSTLIKWFPDRRGMATGMAIMGFGGGAMIGAPLADLLMNHFKTTTSVGVGETLLSMAAIYFVFMMAGALLYRVPPAGWKPDDWVAPEKRDALISRNHVHLNDAHKTPQFWLIWAVLCLNVSAGIGVIGMASPMLQEIFAGALINAPDVSFAELSGEQRTAIAAIAAGFAGLLSLFNIGGRFFWASLSDYIGRKNVYFVFFLLGMLLYALAPTAAALGSKLLFVTAFCIILSMYGGGFATVPAYLADIFGSQFVGAIHGRLLTAWSTAGIVGPVVVNYLREAQLAAGVPRDQVYNFTMYILCGMLALGFVCNVLIKPVDPKWHIDPARLAELQNVAARNSAGVPTASFGIGRGGMDAKAGLLWVVVAVPLAWGLWRTLVSAVRIF